MKIGKKTRTSLHFYDDSISPTEWVEFDIVENGSMDMDMNSGLKPTLTKRNLLSLFRWLYSNGRV